MLAGTDAICGNAKRLLQALGGGRADWIRGPCDDQDGEPSPLCGSVIFLDHFCAFFSDHNGGRIRVAGGEGGHDRGVNHAQPCDTMDTQALIDDRGRAFAHAAGADRVIDRSAETFRVVQKTVVCDNIPAG